MDAWPTSVHGFAVKHVPFPATGPLRTPVNGMLHTIEGWSDEAATSTFHSHPGEESHFSLDGDSITQYHSLAQTSKSLFDGTPADSPNAHCIQIEIAGFSKQALWLPAEATLARLAALVAYISTYWNIPLVVPNPAWRDDCKDMPLPWAVRTNSRRRWAGTNHNWPNQRGWWEHLEVPFNDHWDCGAMARRVVLERAKALLGEGGDGFLAGLTKTQQERIATTTLAAEHVREGQAFARYGTNPGKGFTVLDPKNHENWALGYAHEAALMKLAGETPHPAV